MLWNMLSIEKKIVLYHHGNIICARICMTDKQNRVENERGRAERKKKHENQLLLFANGYEWNELWIVRCFCVAGFCLLILRMTKGI